MKRELTLRGYQLLAEETAEYPRYLVGKHGPGAPYIYPLIGLMGEAGEVAEILKRIGRDSGGIIEEIDRRALRYELGDVLWYVSRLASELGLDLEDIGRVNLSKLASRKRRGTIRGSGDER